MVAASRSRAVYSLTDVTPARTIWVYRNGDPFFLGRKFVVNHRYVPTFEAFMIQLNESVPTPFGVRNVYTPQEGHSVNELNDLLSGGKYVAAGREKFRKLNYFGIGAKKPQRKKKDEMIRPVVHSNIQVPSKWQSFYNKPQILNVFTNGDTLIAPVKIIIPRFTLTKWDRVLGLINEKVLLRSGGIHKLYTMRGQRVHGPEELEDNQYYVACSKEKFQSLPYWQHPKVPENIRRSFGDATPEPAKPPKRKEPDTHVSRSKAFHRPPTQSPLEQPKRREENKNSVFHAQSKKASPERAPKELSSDDGHSVFKAVKRQKETEGAQEIQEDKEVQVDIPVDQAPAETVQEEDVYDNAEDLAEKPMEDSYYEELNYQEKKGIFKKMFGLFHKTSKKRDSETGSSTTRGSNTTKMSEFESSTICMPSRGSSTKPSSSNEEERGDQQVNSASLQQLPSKQLSGNVHRTSQNGLREGGKEQKATKSRDSSIITPREFFDENDYY